MNSIQQLTAIIEREGDGYVGLCPEFDIASQGDTIEAARKNLTGSGRHAEVFVTRLEVDVG